MRAYIKRSRRNKGSTINLAHFLFSRLRAYPIWKFLLPLSTEIEFLRTIREMGMIRVTPAHNRMEAIDNKELSIAPAELKER